MPDYLATADVAIYPFTDSLVNSCKCPAKLTELLRVGTLQWPLGTEWMCMHFNEYGVPTEAKFLGWRTALLTMIRCKAITEAEAHQAFPLVAENRAAQWYLQQLYWLRNPKIQVH